MKQWPDKIRPNIHLMLSIPSNPSQAIHPKLSIPSYPQPQTIYINSPSQVIHPKLFILSYLFQVIHPKLSISSNPSQVIHPKLSISSYPSIYLSSIQSPWFSLCRISLLNEDQCSGIEWVIAIRAKGGATC